MEGKCQDVFEQVAYIYNNAHVLGRVWQGIEPERRQQSIDNLRVKLVILNDKKQVRAVDSNSVFNMLDTLEHYNKGEGTIHNLSSVIESSIVTLAIHAIADCECAREIEKPGS